MVARIRSPTGEHWWKKEYCGHAPSPDQFTFVLLGYGSVIICYDPEPVPNYPYFHYRYYHGIKIIFFPFYYQKIVLDLVKNFMSNVMYLAIVLVTKQ
jgi:hypothetical protein